MNSAPSVVPRWYWIVASLALLWMLFGVLAWVMDLTMSDAALAQMTEAQRQLYLSRPQWVFVVYAIAIFSGLAGVLGLLLRRTWAVPLLQLSLVAVIVQFAYTFLVMKVIQHVGVAAALPLPIAIFAIGAGLVMLARKARREGWLR